MLPKAAFHRPGVLPGEGAVLKVPPFSASCRAGFATDVHACCLFLHFTFYPIVFLSTIFSRTHSLHP